MGRLLYRSFGSIFVMVVLAMAITARHPVGHPVGQTAAQAVAAAQEVSATPWSNAAPAAAPGQTSSGPRVLTRDTSGQFHLDGFVNGRQTSFLVDTGADLVAIPVAEAQRLGVSVRDGDFRPMLQTASGTAEGARVVLDRIEVAGTVLTHVDAVVVRGLATNLLGQSALKQLGRVTLHGDTMVIDPS